MAALFKQPFEIKQYRVVLRPSLVPLGDLTDWCQTTMGPEYEDWGRWHMCTFQDPRGRIDIFRFRDLRDAVLFKMTWGGK